MQFFGWDWNCRHTQRKVFSCFFCLSHPRPQSNSIWLFIVFYRCVNYWDFDLHKDSTINKFWHPSVSGQKCNGNKPSSSRNNHNSCTGKLGWMGETLCANKEQNRWNQMDFCQKINMALEQAPAIISFQIEKGKFIKKNDKSSFA